MAQILPMHSLELEPQRRRARVLLPAALLAAGAVLAAEQLGLAFQAPPSAKLQLRGQQRVLGQQQLQASTFAGLDARALSAPAARGTVEGSSYEASLPLVLAATALAAAATSEAAVEKESSLFDKIKLPIFVGCWYFFNVQYNIQNKMLMNAFSATWAISFIQLASGIPIAMLMWASGLLQVPSVTRADIIKLTPVGAAFAAGQVATVASLGAVAVSFTHVVKALEPAINAVASGLILGQVFHPMVYASLLPVFAGVALASSSELSFTPFGFATAMASNFCFVTRNVLATKFGSTGDMGEDKVTRKTNQLSVLTIVATAVLFPLALLLPGGLMSVPAAWSASIAKGVPVVMADAAGLDLFKQEVSRLQRQVEELRQGLSKVSNEQSMQRRNAELLDEAAQEATQQWVSLEDRIAGLERERETSARASRNNLDSIATRVTELGVEVAQMPTTLEVQDGLMQLEQLVTASEARTRETFRESLDQRLETLQVDTSLKLSECIEGCSKEIQGCILDLGYCREHSDSCRRDISGLLRQIWGDEGLVCDSAAKEGKTGDEQLPQLPRGEASLASRLALAEHEVAALSEHMALKADLEDVVHRLATKAEAGHVHDRLVSADGSASFVL